MVSTLQQERPVNAKSVQFSNLLRSEKVSILTWVWSEDVLDDWNNHVLWNELGDWQRLEDWVRLCRGGQE